jgi:hypothetical protein
MNAADIYVQARLAGDNEELWLVVAAAIDALEAKAEPFFSKDLHDHGVLALARVTWERDDAQIALKASKLVAEIAEEGMVRWKREAEAAKAEIERLRAALTLSANRLQSLRRDVPHAGEWAKEAAEAAKPGTGELDPGKSASSTHDPELVDYVEFTDGTSLMGAEATAVLNRPIIPPMEQQVTPAELREFQRAVDDKVTVAFACPHCGYRHPPDGVCV